MSMNYDRSAAAHEVAAASGAFLSRVYAWMCGALLITAIVSVYVAMNGSLIHMVMDTRAVFIGLLVAEFGLVVLLSALIGRMPYVLAMAVFVLYAALNGMTLSVIFMAYTASSVGTAFFVTAGTFGAMSLYGYVTKRDLTTVGSLCFMALIGLILASVVNLFLGNETVYWITTYAGILIFVGLTAYDTQKIKQMNVAGMEDSEFARKAAILGALTLYLDFINLFLMILRIFGRRR